MKSNKNTKLIGKIEVRRGLNNNNNNNICHLTVSDNLQFLVDGYRL
jgi:hypothetical protein